MCIQIALWGLAGADLVPPCMTPFCLPVPSNARGVWRNAKIFGAERRKTDRACTNKQYQGSGAYASQCESILQYISVRDRDRERDEREIDRQTKYMHLYKSEYKFLFQFIIIIVFII